MEDFGDVGDGEAIPPQSILQSPKRLKDAKLHHIPPDLVEKIFIAPFELLPSKNGKSFTIPISVRERLKAKVENDDVCECLFGYSWVVKECETV